jgi:hypothetical protein
MSPDQPCSRVIERAADIPACVGKTITIRGPVTRTKQPTILGVDVDAAYELSDQLGEATGLLETYTIEERKPGEPIVASRGPGTYYALRDPSGVGLVRAKAAP